MKQESPCFGYGECQLYDQLHTANYEGNNFIISHHPHLLSRGERLYRVRSQYTPVSYSGQTGRNFPSKTQGQPVGYRRYGLLIVICWIFHEGRARPSRICVVATQRIVQTCTQSSSKRLWLQEFPANPSAHPLVVDSGCPCVLTIIPHQLWIGCPLCLTTTIPVKRYLLGLKNVNKINGFERHSFTEARCFPYPPNFVHLEP